MYVRRLYYHISKYLGEQQTTVLILWVYSIRDGWQNVAHFKKWLVPSVAHVGKF